MVILGTVRGSSDSAKAHIEIKRADLSLTADKSVVEPGETIVFTANSNPSGIAFNVTQWQWQAREATPQTVPCTGETCAMAISQNGWMRVIGTITGLTDTATAYVQAVACPAQDDSLGYPNLLNEPAYRDSVKALFGDANAGAHDSLKLELPWLGLWSPTKQDWMFSRIPPTHLDSVNNFHAWYRIPLPLPSGYFVVVAGHPHLYRAGTVVTYLGTKQLDTARVVLFGPSTHDRKEAFPKDSVLKLLGLRYREHIIDPDYIHVVRPAEPIDHSWLLTAPGCPF